MKKKKPVLQTKQKKSAHKKYTKKRPQKKEGQRTSFQITKIGALNFT